MLYRVSVKNEGLSSLTTYTNDLLWAEMVCELYEEVGFKVNPIEKVKTYEKVERCETSLPSYLRRQAF